MKCALDCDDIDTSQNQGRLSFTVTFLHYRGRVPVYRREVEAIHRREDEDRALPLV